MRIEPKILMSVHAHRLQTMIYRTNLTRFWAHLISSTNGRAAIGTHNALAMLTILVVSISTAFAQSDGIRHGMEKYTDLYQQREYAKAEVVAKDTILIAEREPGNNDLVVSGILRDLGEINRALGRYAAAETYLLRALAIIEGALGKEHPELAALLLELTEIHRLQSRFDKARQTYIRAVQIEPTLNTRGGFEFMNSRGALTASHTRLVNSVVDFFDRANAELPDYGRYTYVLFPAPSARNTQVLALLLESTARGWNMEFDRTKLNVFYLPVKHDYQSAARGVAADYSAEQAAQPIAVAYYDYDFAAELLSRLCDVTDSGQQQPGICATALDNGPYMVTLPGPFGQKKLNDQPVLILDLSGIHSAAFDKFIDALKVQVKEPDFTDVERVATTRLALLNIILETADLITPVRTAVADVIEFIEPVSGQ